MDSQLREALRLFYSDNTPASEKSKLNSQLQQFGALDGAWRTCMSTLKDIMQTQLNQPDQTKLTPGAISLEYEIMYYLSVIEHHIRSFWWQEAKISRSDHLQMQKDSLEIYGLLISSKTLKNENSDKSSISNQTVGVLLPKYITEKLALLLAGTYLTEIRQFLSSQLEQIFANLQYRQYAYYVLKAFADQLQSPLVKLPVSKLNDFKQTFFEAVHMKYFDQILTDLAKLRNNGDLTAGLPNQQQRQLENSLFANTGLASFENLTNLYVSTIGSIVSVQT